MKKLLFSMLMLLACTATAMAQDVEYKISGTLPAGVHQVLIVANNDRTTLQRDTICQGGKFAFTGKAPANALMLISYFGEQRAHIYLFNDGTPINVDFTSKKATCSPLNQRLMDFWVNIGANMRHQVELAKEQKQAGTTDARKKEIETELDKLDKESDNILLQFYRNNKDNVLPAALAPEYSYAFNYDELSEFCAPGTAYYNHPAMAQAKQLLAGLQKRHAGQPFQELTMADMDGKTVKLSQWVGQGQYVLVDFWASWCGPCRREMPNVVAAYKRYHASKGFNVVGVSFDNNADKWKAAVKQLGMEWPQMSDLKGWKCAASEVYGVSSIPSNILVDPKGKIVASDLRGEELLAKLKEIYGE